MAYSGSGLLMAAELMSDTRLWSAEEQALFRDWVLSVYRPAVNEIRVHKNNWADWGRFGSLLAASYLNDTAEVAANVRLIKSDFCPAKLHRMAVCPRKRGVVPMEYGTPISLLRP